MLKALYDGVFSSKNENAPISPAIPETAVNDLKENVVKGIQTAPVHDKILLSPPISPAIPETLVRNTNDLNENLVKRMPTPPVSPAIQETVVEKENVETMKEAVKRINKINFDSYYIKKFGKNNPNFVDKNGRTLLHHAAIEGSYQGCKEQLDLGVDFEIKDNFNETAMDYATQYQHSEIRTLLFEKYFQKISM